MNREDYLKSEKKQTVHRVINTILALMVLAIGIKTFLPLYDRISGLEEQRVIESEIAQIVKDEGYRAKPYKDSLGLWTIGFGHLIKEGEDLHELTPHDAVQLLRKDYTASSKTVDRLYPWADGDVRLVLINMVYQMGPTGVGKFKKTINYLKEGEYDLAAGEMLTSRWAKQTPLRASRLAGRIMALSG